MSQRGVEGLLGRLITDGGFRERFYEEPAAICVDEAMDVTTRELEAILALKQPRIEDFAKLLDSRIVRAVVSGEHHQKGKPESGTVSRSTLLVSDAATRPKQQRVR